MEKVTQMFTIFIYIFKEHPPPPGLAGVAPAHWRELARVRWRGRPKSPQGIRGPGQEEGAAPKLMT